jgi:MscS family membrane protein
LYVPNATFSQIAVENPSRMTHRRIYETIGLRYQDARQVRAIVTAVKDYLAQHEDLDTTQTIIVNFNRFSESSLDFFIYCFTKTTDWVTYHKVKERVLLDILDIIHAHGADVAFPTRTLYLENNKTG